jgi:uncharacterized protein HemX
MSELFRTLSEHPLAAATICFVFLLVLYFIGKKLLKLALILLIIAIAIGGYYYLQYPEERPADVKETLEKARAGTDRAVEKGREAVEKGRELLEKGSKEVEKGESTLNRWIGAVKAFIDRMKKAAAEIGKIFGGERDGGDSKKSVVRP